MRRMVLALTIGMCILAGPAMAAEDANPGDQQVAQKIADSFKQSGKLKGYSIGVSYKDGVARLEGWVRNAEQMERAMEIARESADVADVVNELTVLADPSVTRAAPGKPQTFQPAAMKELAETPAVEEEEVAPSQESSYGDIDRVASAPIESEKTALQPAAYPGAPRMARQGRGIRQNGRVMQGQGYQQQASQGQYYQGPPVGQPVGQAAQQGAPQDYAAARQQAQYVAMMRAQQGQQGPPQGGPLPAYVPGSGGGVAPAVYDQPNMPNYAWPSYAAYPNYAGVTYPKQYSPTAWPYIGPFYPYPQVPLGWRKVTLEWDDGWWFLNFQDDRLHVGTERRLLLHH
ncbi:MAG: BON domain-containing protein [Pirellulales bacterium]